MNYIPIPKTASTTIREVLCIHADLRRASEVRGLKFTFVRHPMDRLVSMWLFSQNFRTEKMKRYATGNETFAEFMQIPDNLLTAPQTYWIDAKVDFVGRFETLRESLAELVSAYPKEFPHIRAGRPLKAILPAYRKNTRGPWQSYFTPATLAVAVARYAADFSAFGYPVPEARDVA